MSYTLTMAADQEPKIATDGVQEVPLTIARPLLTRLIEQALEESQVSALTVRSRRRAYLVTPDFYEQAVKDRRMVAAFHEAVADLPAGQKPDKLLQGIIGRLTSD